MVSAYRGFDRAYDLTNDAALEKLSDVKDFIKNGGDVPRDVGNYMLGYIEVVSESLAKYEEIRVIMNDSTRLSVAFCAWYYEKNAKLSDGRPKSKNRRVFDKIIYVDYLGSIKSGAGTELLKDILQMGEMDNIPVSLQAAEQSFGFYEKMGMTRLLDGQFVWFPSGVRNDCKYILDSDKWIFNDGRVLIR